MTKERIIIVLIIGSIFSLLLVFGPNFMRRYGQRYVYDQIRAANSCENTEECISLPDPGSPLYGCGFGPLINKSEEKWIGWLVSTYTRAFTTLFSGVRVQTDCIQDVPKNLICDQGTKTCTWEAVPFNERVRIQPMTH